MEKNIKVSRVSEMRAMDRTAIEKYGIRADLLMENAGHAVYFVILNEFGVERKKFIVFSGPGNNGGDGFVVGRKLYSTGAEVKIFVLGDPEKLSGSARLNFEIANRLPIEVRQISSVDEVEADVARCEAVVDAILGTGISRNVTGLYRDVIELVNTSGKRVFSVDIPSGVHGDSGQVMGAAIRADCTITFGLPKTGNLLYPGYDLGGKLYVSHISFPRPLYENESIKVAVDHSLRLPVRDKDAHKGDLGQMLFIAGAASYYGAPYFAALSFLKAGGGYSRLAAPQSIVPIIAGKGSEMVFIPQAETDAGGIALRNKHHLLELSSRLDMVILGPGLSMEQEVQQLACELVEGIGKPLLLDGDGITALCQHLDLIKGRKAPTVLTPHLGEMSRITGLSVSEIKHDRIGILQRTAGEINAIIVLKGAHSLIGYPDGCVFINMSGNPGMATAGSGDVLTGAIAAMFGLGLSLPDAVRKGVFIHGLAGDLAAREKGEDGITAQDIMEYLPYAIRMERDGLEPSLKERYAGARVI